MRPEISTVSADGTHIDSPSAMSEVTDNHAVEMDPYDLTGVVREAGKKAAEVVGVEGLKAKVVKEKGVVSELWSGFVDDLMGPRKPGHA